MLKKAFGNWHTTLFGTLGGLFYYLSEQGITIPDNQEEYGKFGVALALAVFGWLAKDGKTGSAP